MRNGLALNDTDHSLENPHDTQFRLGLENDPEELLQLVHFLPFDFAPKRLEEDFVVSLLIDEVHQLLPLRHSLADAQHLHLEGLHSEKHSDVELLVQQGRLQIGVHRYEQVSNLRAAHQVRALHHIVSPKVGESVQVHLVCQGVFLQLVLESCQVSLVFLRVFAQKSEVELLLILSTLQTILEFAGEVHQFEEDLAEVQEVVFVFVGKLHLSIGQVEGNSICPGPED